MFASRMYFVCIFSIMTLAPPAPGTAPRGDPAPARSMDIPWLVLIYYLNELEVILFGEDIPPARDGFAPPEKLQAEAEAQAYVATQACQGIRSGLTENDIADAEVFMDDTIEWLDANPDGLDDDTEADLRGSIAEQRAELGL